MSPGAFLRTNVSRDDVVESWARRRRRTGPTTTAECDLFGLNKCMCARVFLNQE